MRKTILILMAVAILGGLALRRHGSDNTLPTNSSNKFFSSTNGQSQALGASSTADSNADYKDGTYTGEPEDTAYGTVQIAVVVSGGKIADVRFLQMPSDLGHSVEVTNYSEPLLKQTTLNHQNANIDFVSGATQTSEGYQQSLQAALDKAVVS